MVNQQYGARFRAQSGGPYDHGWHQTLAPGTLVPGAGPVIHTGGMRTQACRVRR